MAAIALDVDDTTLATWNHEIVSNWAFNPTINANFVLGGAVPPGAGDGRHGAAEPRAQGYAIFFLTGRADLAGGCDARQHDRFRQSA